MKFSLIMATLGRSDEIRRLFESLVLQQHQDFELIVVDQNEDDRVRRIVADFEARLDIKYLQSAKGLSRARNVGLKAVTGEVVCFPDDDCWYRPETLAFVAGQLQADAQLGGVTGMSIDAQGRPSQGRWASEPLTMTRYNVWKCATSYTIFLRAAAVRAVGGFDEALGVGSGSRWGAGEEVNYLLGVLREGWRVVYQPELKIHHPEPLLVMDEKAFNRARLYNRGFGRVLGLNAYPAPFVLYLISRSVAACALAALKGDLGRARYAWIAASQRFLGWVD